MTNFNQIQIQQFFLNNMQAYKSYLRLFLSCRSDTDHIHMFGNAMEGCPWDCCGPSHSDHNATLRWTVDTHNASLLGTMGVDVAGYCVA